MGSFVTVVDTQSAGELVTLSAIHSAQCNLPDDIMRCVTRNVIGVSCCVWYLAGGLSLTFCKLGHHLSDFEISVVTYDPFFSFFLSSLLSPYHSQ